MKAGLSIFQRLMMGLVLMCFLIVIIFFFIYRFNVSDIQEELKKNKISEVKFMTSQLSTQFEQILINTITMSEDQTVRGYPYVLQFGDHYSKYETKLTIIDKLALNSASTSWNNTITLYYPDLKETVSSDPTLSFSSFNLPSQPLNKWIVYTKPDGTGYYSNLMRSHIGPLYIETRISLDNLRRMLKQYTSGTPLLYDSYNDVIIQNGNSPLLEDTTSRIIPLIEGNSGFLSMDDNGTEYLLNYMKSSQLNLYFIDYHPMRQFIEPISRNNAWFVVAIVVLLLISLIYSLVLRRQVQSPIVVLRKAIDRFDRGDFSSRVPVLNANEFRMLGNSFNRMAENTQQLIEQVLVGELEVKDARLKQYQAQINPHFLYNCLNYIQSKASVEDYESVTAMTLHLGAYSRYVHKIEHIDSTFNEELAFVEHYLSILQLRKKSMTFSFDISPQLRMYRLPRMILQPLVENCIQHGIEPSLHAGHITITIEEDEHALRLIIRDNGVGMSDEKLASVNQHMEQFLTSENRVGTGLRNVHQRLKLYFGKRSGLSIRSQLSDGTSYIITIQKQEDNHAAVIVS